MGPRGVAACQISIPAFRTTRVYNYLLGGKDNFAADREAGERFLAVYPNVVHSVRANRAFLARAVRFLASDMGIRQFLDIGTGIPTANNTHEVAQRFAPGSRVVYVDNDRCKFSCVHDKRLSSATRHAASPSSAISVLARIWFPHLS